MKITDYTVVYGNTIPDIREKVNELINDGWQPFGAFGAVYGDNEWWWNHQAMVKYENPALSNDSDGLDEDLREFDIYAWSRKWASDAKCWCVKNDDKINTRTAGALVRAAFVKDYKHDYVDGVLTRFPDTPRALKITEVPAEYSGRLPDFKEALPMIASGKILITNLTLSPLSCIFLSGGS